MDWIEENDGRDHGLDDPFVRHGVTVTIMESGGSDGAVVVFVDTKFEPDGSDGGSGLRIVLNDCDVLNASGTDPVQGGPAATGGIDYQPRVEGASRG